MPEQYYKEAQKLAQKEYRSCVSEGQYEYLPALDDFVPAERTAMGTDLGVVQVPAEFIVGTKTRSRTKSFARNFMPLLEEDSEFAVKWKRLCEAHLEEGIRDPVKVYEYLNRFYVEEGNKRVSVLKFFDAVFIPAKVIRVLPDPSERDQHALYFEFLSFYRISRINFVEFTKKGSYARLQRLLGKAPEEVWSDDDQSSFNVAYHSFREVYEASGGKKLASTVGDALLAYIEIYGFPALTNRSREELRRTVRQMWEEIKLQQEETPIELKRDPTEEKKKPLLAKMLPVNAPKLLKVAFLYDKMPKRSGWAYGHELGRRHVQRVLDDKIVTKAYTNTENNVPDLIEQAISEGNQVLFTTSPRMLMDSLRAAVDHPDITIMNCSLNTSHRYIRTYYARMYEVKFIIGAIAGVLSESGRIGYVCDYPIYGQISGINAFAQGVQMVNPRAKVHVEWSSVGSSKAAIQRLQDQNIRLISSQDLTPLTDIGNSSFGLSRITAGEQELLAVPIWKWGIYYEEMLRLILNKTVQSEYQRSSKALNYYWGMSAGVVDLFCTKAVPESVRKLADYLKEGVRRKVCNPFTGRLHTQQGYTVGEIGQELQLEQIANMDYLVENVVGVIPAYEELNPTGKATVDMVGVEPSVKRDSLEAGK